MKTVLAVLQPATFLLCFFSSADTVVDSFQVIVSLLSALHHLNNLEVIPGVRYKFLT